MAKRRVKPTPAGGNMQFLFGEVNPQLYDPGKGWFDPDPETRSANEQIALVGELARGIRPALMPK